MGVQGVNMLLPDAVTLSFTLYVEVYNTLGLRLHM